nr:ribonuclease H-like domain-containing protein [Tanacetum cinerariifolium]
VKQKKDGIFISQDKYVVEILRKFRLTEEKSASTPIDTEKPFLKDPDGEDVDVHTYSFGVDAVEDFKEYTLRDYYSWLKTYCCCFGVDAVEDFKEYTLRDYYCWLKTYCCWYKLNLLDNAADSRLRLLEESGAAADDKIKNYT